MGHVGPYDGLPQAYAAMVEWMTKNGRVAAKGGEVREVYLSDPEKEPPEQWRTQTYILLKPVAAA